MLALAATEPQFESPPQKDHRIVFYGVSWEFYEQMLQARGDHRSVRIAYCEGTIEFMSPSRPHERIKATLARMVEMYALARGIDLYGVGSWTIRKELVKRGVEPDECYSISNDEPEERPDLAIEVVWTTGGIDKLEIYCGLQVPEVWIWRENKITVHGLRGEHYVELPRSALLPGFAIEHVLPFLTRSDQPAAVREYWAWLQDNPE